MNIRSKIFGGKAEEVPLVQGKKSRGTKPEGLHKVSVARQETRRSNTRDADRHRLPDEQVRICYKGKDYDVQLVNLSGGGAMVAGEFEPKLWDRVQLHLGENGTIECAVRWIKGGRVGLEFAHETRLDCTANEQVAVLREVITRSFPDVEFDLPVPAPTPTKGKGRGSREHRADRRHPLIWSGVIHHDYQSTPVRLRNISSTGAMIECHAPLREGAELLFDLGEAGSVFASVSWLVGDSAGLKFKDPFDLGQLARARPDVANSQWQAPSYLQPGVAEDSPWDEHMSLGELRTELEGFLKR